MDMFLFNARTIKAEAGASGKSARLDLIVTDKNTEHTITLHFGLSERGKAAAIGVPVAEICRKAGISQAECCARSRAIPPPSP